MMNTIFVRGAMLAVAVAFATSCQTAAKTPARPHNVIIFIADGLRYGSVNPTDAPALAAVRDEGVDFTNSHSIYPTITTVNASAIATGHAIGDTGNFGNNIYVGPLLPEAEYSRIAPFENDAVLKAMNARFGGNYLNEETLLAAARAKGFSVAALGKTGPAAIQDVTRVNEPGGIIIDDSFGTPEGPALPPGLLDEVKAAGLPTALPPRSMPNVAQQKWLADIVGKVLLPRFKKNDKPFVIAFWSGDPDAAQHAQQDSRGKLIPGVNGPTSLAGIKNASDTLAALRAALKEQGLDATTDIFVTADHGFSTVSKESKTSNTMKTRFRDFPEGELPQGFLALDVADALKLKVFEPNGAEVAREQGLSPRRGSAMLGEMFDDPRVVIAANGGSDEIWLTGDDAAQLAPKVVEFLTTQDYTAAIFVDDSFGPIPGALPLSAIRLKGSARTPTPSIIVSFRSWHTDCAIVTQCTVEIADTSWKTGGGIHGSLHRGDTRNFMAAIGPDFKAKTDILTPVSNADIAPTLAKILGLAIAPKGSLRGRVITEALKGGRAVKAVPAVRRSTPAANGFATVLDLQLVGDAEYYDAAGADGRAVGLRTEAERAAIEKAAKPKK